ncbi:MAG: ornithine carbamoyltransferase [Desulfomicrobium sp.]|nr:ornithine carbamoyltransferase [Pseudomonadota bacterium]MBU4569779.1 ornithine carbamoyltransferase [Pseudomonadota bacterium]MBU4595502.1 ornithine carbamoyltransferase [Pseudomonadota bacterium]MBV1711108.1 ornithine carbamoyltransferase [Desulfomicrobium sp.]MBV1747138.1 ornithine carbamoyltransferase [Desulfomicrobium sp.]
MMKHFLSIKDLLATEAMDLVLRAKEMKDTDYRSNLLAGKTLAMIFEKASTRTRVSFEVGIRHLGGDTVFMTPADSQLGRSEPLADTARVLSRYVQGMVVRTFAQKNVEDLALHGSIPVVNALTDMFHPCQIMSDMLTIYERNANLRDVVISWIGDGNNMANSWINASVYFGFQLNMACPEGYMPNTAVLERALKMGAKVFVTEDPKAAIAGSHFVNTDVWASMGQEAEQKKREKAFAGYQVNEELLALADPDAKVMHCLPAHRGEEISAAVFEGPRSIVFDQAENRLHMQKAILEWIYS